MEKHQQDKGLRKAMKTSVSPRLSTNFTFRTMLKVEEAMPFEVSTPHPIIKS